MGVYHKKRLPKGIVIGFVSLILLLGSFTVMTGYVAEAKDNVVLSETKLREYTDIVTQLPDGITSLEQLYYGSVAKDTTAPFHSASELQKILEYAEETYAKQVWEKYRYDLYDLNFSNRGGCGALAYPSGLSWKKAGPGDRPDYADELLEKNDHEYPKDGKSPFHESPSVEMKAVDATLVDGVLIESDENAFKDLSKTVSPDEGDANTERKYTVDLEATAELKQVKPTVMIFQIQTSWQMFDLLHANDRASLWNGNKVTKELLSLYEMKQAFLDFMDWMEENGNGSVMMGITNFQHGGTNNMLGEPYYTNDISAIREGLYGWDSFGDCEHIHYGDKALDLAIKELKDSDNFEKWVDQNGTSIYENAEIVSVIVGGACEVEDLKYKKLLPDLSTNENNKLKHQYGIRTNSGTGVIDKISWLDYEAAGDKNGGKFDTGKYYTDVVTRQDFFDALVDIYCDLQDEKPLSEVRIEDTISAEFDVDKTGIKAYVGDVDVTESTTITVEKQQDGTTKVVCKYDSVNNYEKVHLHIPIQAKTDFIGSNNVKTNSGTPTISYNGRIDQDKVYAQNFTDDPAANVPIRFTVSDGDSVTISPGQTVDLVDLAVDESGGNIITGSLEALLGKYAQIEGTVIYQWVDQDGNLVGSPTSAVIDTNSRVAPAIPSLEVTAEDGDIGKTIVYKLQATFTPVDLKQETTSKVAVSQKAELGAISIEVVKPQFGTITIRKVIDNYNKYGDELAGEEFMITVDSVAGTEIHTSTLLKHNQSSAAIIVDAKTTLKVQEIIPKEYKLIRLTANDGSGETIISGNVVTVDLGEEITISLHNEYQWQPYFHSFDTIGNQFKAVEN